MPIGSRAPRGSIMSNVINVKISVRGHVENVLAVGRDDALTRLESLTRYQICCAPTGLWREWSRAGGRICARRPFEDVDHEISVILHHDGLRIGSAGLRGPETLISRVVKNKVPVRLHRRIIRLWRWLSARFVHFNYAA